MTVNRRELERLIPALRRYATGLVGDAVLADDLVQDCLVRALDREDQFRGINLSGWLFTILTNLSRSHLRRERVRAADMLDDELPDQGTPDPALRQTIVTALAVLPAEQREALLLVALEGFTYQETADILGVPIGTVMSRIARARGRLTERLDGADVLPLRRSK